MTPMYTWKTTEQFTEPTRKLSSFVVPRKGHAAPVETFIIIFKTQDQEQEDD